jgi:hypothetical protein
MSRYFVQFVNLFGQTSVWPEPLDCSDDAQAVTRARALVGAQDVELWEGRRLVEVFPRNSQTPVSG